MRAKQCGLRYRYVWLFLVLALSRVKNWELVLIPALAVTMLVLSERNQRVSAERQHLLIGEDDHAETV